MGATEIEWATDVWNFVRGCRRVSPGCGGAKGVGGCYAEGQANRFKGPGQPYEGLVQLTKQGPRWTGVGRFVAEKLAEPLRARPLPNGERRRWFVNSMSDLFFEEFTNEQIAAGFGVMAACPHDDFLILTKRPARMLEWFESLACSPHMELAGAADKWLKPSATMARRLYRHFDDEMGETDLPWPLPNVWIGVSCEDQQRANERIPLLRRCPAVVHFLSMEPLIGPVTLDERWLEWLPLGPDENGEAHLLPPIRWIIAGGESGNGARPCDVQWLRSIVAQCETAGTPVFLKQLGAEPGFKLEDEERRGNRMPSFHHGRDGLFIKRLVDSKGGDPSEWPEELRVRQFPEARP